MAGFWLSRTITSCMQVAVLPLASVTVQVTVLVPTGNWLGASLRIVAPGQLSVMVGVPRFTPVAKHWSASVLTVPSSGQVMAGFWLSRTITSCMQVAVLPPASVTVQVTVLVPTGNWLGALLVRARPGQLSLMVGIPRFTPVAKHWTAAVLTVTSSGQAMVGFWLSRTITFWVQVAVLPLASVTVQVTVLVPIGNWLGALLLMVEPGQLSVMVGLPRFTPVAKH